MKSSLKSWVYALGIAALVGLAPARVVAQQSPQQPAPPPHVVSTDELTLDRARPAEARRANEEAVRELLSSAAGQKALQSANVEYQRVDKAIGQLSDEDLAKVAERSRQAQSDFAAGGLSSRLVIVIILIIILIIVLAIVF